jgi:hypothetical protein
MQHRGGRHDGRLHDVPELRRLEMRLSRDPLIAMTNYD